MQHKQECVQLSSYLPVMLLEANSHNHWPMVRRPSRLREILMTPCTWLNKSVASWVSTCLTPSIHFALKDRKLSALRYYSNLPGRLLTGLSFRQAILATPLPSVKPFARLISSRLFNICHAFPRSRQEPVQAQTVATAIKIGNPVSYTRARRVIEESNGIVEDVTDEEILAAKTIIDRAGLGCEPASAATLAGIRKLVERGVIKRDERVVGILTGNLLKDSQTGIPQQSEGVAVAANIDAIRRIL